MSSRTRGWIKTQFAEASKRVESGPAWMKKAAASDYSARRQIHESPGAESKKKDAPDSNVSHQ